MTIDTRFQLSPREEEIIRLLVQGYRPREIAQRLEIAENTARTHVKAIHQKTGARTTAQAAALYLFSRTAMTSPSSHIF